MPGSFFDTNVLLYIASFDPAKADRAEELIGAGGMISVQVLNEITNVARRKMGMSWAETRAFLSTIRGLLPVRSLTIDIHETAVGLAERYRLSTWDATIAASAATRRLRHPLVRRYAGRDRARRPAPRRQPISRSVTCEARLPRLHRHQIRRRDHEPAARVCVADLRPKGHAPAGGE